MILYHSGNLNPGMNEEIEALMPEDDINPDGTMLILRGRPRLISYADVLRGQLAETSIPAMRRAHRQLVLDSGAFTMSQGGDPISVEQYSEFLKRWEEHFDFITNLDVIKGKDSHKLSAENQLALEALGHTPLPVFHHGEPFVALEEMVEAYDYIGLGGLVGFRGGRGEKDRWLMECFDLISDRARVHGYGVADVNLVRGYPWFSIDSTAWLAAGRYGNWPPFISGVYSYAARAVLWLEYHETVAAAAGKDYDHAEDKTGQHGLFGPITLDRKRDSTDKLRTLGPVELCWPRRETESPIKARVNAILVVWGPRPLDDPLEPLNGAGGELLGACCGMSVPEFLDRVPRSYLNLDLAGDETVDDVSPLSELVATAAATLVLRCSRIEVPVVIVGRQTAQAFDIRPDQDWFEWFEISGATVAVSPHPEENADWWSQPENLTQARAFYHELAVPHIQPTPNAEEEK